MKKKAIAEDPLVIEKRWQKKRESIETLANNIRSFRNNVTRDLQSEDEKIFLTALAIDLMDTTAERVGNEASASKGHIGITGLKKSNITIDGNKITLRYTGKSGVEHEKSFSDERLAKNLKRAMDISPTKYLLCTSAHFRIKPDRINRFLNEYNLSAKDIRGYSANQWLLEKLRKQDVSPEEKIRKTDFLKAAKAIAQKVGHGLATLRKHYMIPELETEYVQHGRIINIKELGYMKQGGEVEKNSSIEKIDIPNLEVDKFNFRGDGIFDFDEAKKFIKKWLDIDIVKTLGDGTNGIVFLTSDNKAIKLTKSKREAEFWSKLVGVKSDYTPDIYFVKQCGANRREIYVILREPLDEILKNDENYVYWDIMLTLDKRRILEKSNFEEEAQKFEVHWDELPRKLTSDELKIVSGYYKQYQEMRSFFKEKGLKPNDFTTENIGFKSGKLVCFDCQYENGGEIQKTNKGGNLKIDNYTEQYNPDGTMFKPYDLRVEFRDVLFNPSPSEKDIERLNKWLREHKMNYVKMYHGAPAKHVQGILEKGLLPTSDKRRNSYQSQSGYVYLSVLPKSSKIFAELADAHNVENNTVFEVVALVNSLLPDTDQLNNYRGVKENWDIGNSLGESIIYGHGARVKGKVDRNALRIIREDDIAYFEQGGTLLKPAYLMTLQEYQQTVTPLIQEYNKFVKKNEKFLIKPSYSGIVFKTYPEYRDAFDVSKIKRYDYNKDRTDEEFIREEWNYKKTGVYDNRGIHESQNAPAALVEQNKIYYDKLSAFFTKDELERLIDKDETKSNKRSVRRAIDNGTYKNLLEQEKITIAELKTIADSVDVKIPKRIMDEHRAPDDVYKKVYDAMPAINRAILSKLVEDIKTAFLPMEKSIHARETERYNKEIADVLGRDGFDLIDLNNIIPFAVKIFTFKSEEKTRQREVRNKYGHYIRTVAEPYTYVFDFDLQDNWEQQLEKEVTNYVELLKGQMIQAIIDNFQKITLPITGFTLIRLEEGRKGFEGVIDFAFNNGSSFRFNTEAIGAGGYNIQIYHFRYLHKFTSIKLADGTVTHNEPLSYIIKHFSDAEVSAQVFNPYNTTKNATTLEEIAVPLYKFLKDFGYQIKNVRLNEGKKEISISFQQEERFRFRSRAIYMQREMPLDYNKQKVYKMLASLGVKPPDGFILPEEPAQPKTMKQGGKVEDAVDENKELYARWKKLVNMTYSELKDFYDSAEGKEAGLSKDKADDLGIGSGRESARWIMKMKQTPNEKWTPLMWDWAKRQVSFIARMSGNKGEMYDERGNKTRKHLSLLIWGHNPDKLQDGGELKQNSYQQRIADNMKFMGTGFKEWKATPILMFQKTVNKKGEEVSMPVFDFPKDYTHANSLFKMNNDGTMNCELCGRIPINTVFWIQNDTQKLTLGVGSECVKYVGDGSSGKENARKAKLELAKMLDNDLQILSGIVKKNCSRVRNIGYGKQEREWSNMYVGDADFGEFAKKASDAVKSLNPDLLFAPKKYQSDTRGYILWSYVYKTIPVFDYQGELDLVKRNYQTLETADKKLLSWFTRNEEMASRLIPQITGTLEIYLNAPIDYVSDYMKAKDTAPETKLQYGGDITEVTGFLEFTPENIEQVMKSIDLVNLAEQHHVGLGVIEKQFAMGLQIEKEHTNNLLIAAEIVKDHLAESVQYYTLLDEMEKRFELGRVVDYENIDQDIPDELIKYPNLKNGGSVVNQTPPSINSQTTLSCMQNTVNKLTGEHKKAYALCEELCISKKTEFQDATHLLKEWSSVIFNHFQKEESEIFNNSQDEQCKKFLAEHKVFYSLINKIKTRPKKSDIIEFSKLLKQHIIDEETYFSAIQFKNGGLTSSLTLLAPNGKPSNLTLEQYRLVRTPAFIKWFGDWVNSPKTASKVVDENGEPMVVYHGTRNEFTVFDKKMAKDKEGKSLNLGWGKGVFYFHKNEKTALGYANRKTRNEKYYEGVKSKSLSVFLNIKNTFDVDKNYLRVRANRDGFKDTVSDIWWSKYPDSKNLRREALIKQLKIEGYDGLMDDDEFTVFYPTQIKLADGSNTTFDGSNSDIRFEQGGGILTQNNFIGTWSELQKQKPELWNTGILRRSLNPRGATDIIPADIHTKQGQWQNYGQYDEIEAETIYGKPDNYDYYNDKDGNPIVDIRTGDYLKDKLDYDNNAERIKATISNEQLKNNLIESFDTKEGKEYLSKVIAALPKNPDGSITAYRIGSIGDGIKSYTVSEGMAKTFSNQGTDIMPAGLPSLPSAGYSDFGALPANVVKIDPKGIVAWSPYDSEILVAPEYIKTIDGSNTDTRFEQGGEITDEHIAVWRGEPEGVEPLSKDAVWVSTDKSYAAEYGNPVKYMLSNNLNLLVVRNAPGEYWYKEFRDLVDMHNNLSTVKQDYESSAYEPSDNFIAFLKSKGYDGFKNMEAYLIFDKKNILPNAILSKLKLLQDEYRKLNEIASAYDNVVNPKPPLPKATYAENKKFVEDAKQQIKKLKEEALVALGLNFEPGKKLTINNKDYTVSKKIKANYEDAYILTGSRGGEYVLIFGNPVFAEKFSLFKEQAYGRNYIVNQQPLSMLSDKMAKGGTVSDYINETNKKLEALRNDKDYAKKVEQKERERKQQSDSIHFTFEEIRALAKKVDGSVFPQDKNRYSNYEYILFNKYTIADRAIVKLKQMGYVVSERANNPANAYFKFKVYVAKPNNKMQNGGDIKQIAEQKYQQGFLDAPENTSGDFVATKKYKTGDKVVVNGQEYFVNGLDKETQEEYLKHKSSGVGYQEAALAKLKVNIVNARYFTEDNDVAAEARSWFNDKLQPTEAAVRRAMIWSYDTHGDYQIKSGGDNNSESVFISNFKTTIADPNTGEDKDVVVIKKYSIDFKDVLITIDDIQQLQNKTENQQVKNVRRADFLQTAIALLLRHEQGLGVFDAKLKSVPAQQEKINELYNRIKKEYSKKEVVDVISKIKENTHKYDIEMKYENDTEEKKQDRYATSQKKYTALKQIETRLGFCELTAEELEQRELASKKLQKFLSLLKEEDQPVSVVLPEPEIIDTESEPVEEQPSNIIPLPEKENEFYQSVKESLTNSAELNNPYLDKLAVKYELTDKADNPNKALIKELTELAICNTARELASHSTSIDARFRSIVDLYYRQPNISHRTSESILLQQYSTPVPICFLAGVFCGINEPEKKAVVYPAVKSAKKVSIGQGYKAHNMAKREYYGQLDKFGSEIEHYKKGGELDKLFEGKLPENVSQIKNILYADDFYDKEHIGAISKAIINVDDILLKYSPLNPLITSFNEQAYFHPHSEHIMREGIKIAFIKYAAHFVSSGNPRREDTSKVAALKHIEEVLTTAKHRFIQKNDTDIDSIIYLKELVEKGNTSVILVAEINQNGQIRAVTHLPSQRINQIKKKIDAGVWIPAAPINSIPLSNIGLPINITDRQQAIKEQSKSSSDNKSTTKFDTGGIISEKLYFEPSAGNGNMTIAAAPENFIVNEIDKIRNRNLQSVGFKEVLRLDASEPFAGMEKKYNAVLTNPPFGTLDIHKPMGGLPIKKLEHLMAVYALQTMKDNGKCAIIIGGHLKYDEKGRVQSGANRDFYIYLHRFYNVADSINLSGNLYSRQGTSIGIRLILIDGRKAKPEGFPPLENKKLDNVTPGSSAIVNTYDELLERVKNNL